MMNENDAAPSPAGLRFLVVEDHGFQRWALGNTLASMGARDVMSASDGRAALDIMDGLDGALDVIVTDLDMPEMDGLEFIRHVGQRYAPVAVILASGLDHSLLTTVENMARAYGVNLHATLEKPVTAKKLEVALRGYRSSPAAPGPRPQPVFDEQDIRAAIANGELEPFFQAKVQLVDTAVTGAEALARWRHPQKGIILPGAFLPLIESAGLGEDLAMLMAARAARACKSWRSQGLPGTVSINLSPDVLAHLGFAERLREVLRAEGLEPALMTLEVIESASAAPEALENLSRLRMHGFGLAIDDYGMGYSSMDRLTRIAFTELKIDRSFVRDALAQESSLAMLESSLEMAKKMKIVAVAEGVERAVEWSLLAKLGCDQAQGFLIARPMDAASYVEWLRQDSRKGPVPGAGAIPGADGHPRSLLRAPLHREAR
jgi:EAL domain-containing protein (putative c-di-GMP-specific phosphodiesterase class I)